MKKHRPRESSFNKVSALQSTADTETHLDDEKEKKQKPHKETEKSHEKHKPEKRHAKKSKNAEEKDTPDKELTKKEADESREEKRTDIIEKSFALKKHFEDTPLPKDPRLIARLIVADHIISLHEQLETPEQESEYTPEELLDALDYMGELAEKLEDPEREVTPEIEETYEALIKATEHALEHTTPDTIITADDTNTVSGGIFKETTERQPEANANSRASKEHPTKKAREKLAPLAPLIAATIITNLEHAPEVKENHGGDGQLNRLSPAEARHEYLRAVAREHHTIRPLTVSATPIAALAITSSLRSEQAPVPSSDTALNAYAESHSKIAGEHSSLEAVSYSHQTNDAIPTASPNHATFQPSGLPVSTETAPTSPANTIEASLPAKKLEHLPLQSLLAIANSVPVGYGRYLRKEFEQNNIDKEGLIKVLKARAKGRDFEGEYQRQAERFRTLKATSPEFLHTSPLQDNHPSAETASASSEQLPAAPVSMKQPEIPHPLLADDASLQKAIHSQPAKPTLTTWLIIGLAICVIVCAIILFFALKP